MVPGEPRGRAGGLANAAKKAKGKGLYGPAKGVGTGGEAKAFTAETPTVFTADNQPSPELKIAGHRNAIADKTEVLTFYTDVLRNPEEVTANKLHAGEKLLDRLEGKPVARNVNFNIDDLSELTVEQLEERLAQRLAGSEPDSD